MTIWQSFSYYACKLDYNPVPLMTDTRMIKIKENLETPLLFADAYTEKRPVRSPFLKWAGGKSQLLTELRKFVPLNFERYLEPFAGGAALFFDLQPKVAILNDSNAELINTYKIVRDDVSKLVELLSTYPNNS